MIPPTVLKGFPWPPYILNLKERTILWRAEPYGLKFKNSSYLSYYGCELYLKGQRIVWGHMNVYQGVTRVGIFDRRWITHADKRDDVFFDPERVAEFNLY